MKNSKLMCAVMLCAIFVMRGVVEREADGAPVDYETTDHYAPRNIEGWQVLVNKEFLKSDAELADRTLTLLRHQLYQVGRRLPASAVTKLRTIRIWVERDEPHHPCMAYHPDPGWLRDHGMNPEKSRCVEIANARNFLSWTVEQPWMVLHELAHGFHHQFRPGGYDNPEIEAAYRRAMKSGAYKSVLRINGDTTTAYAVENPMEYFAEGSEAFFGTNDFYPFVRAELRRHDPELYEMLRKVWGEQ